MIRQALILAAGVGSRIRTRTEDLPKPLHTVNGVPLIRRVILSLAAGGIKRIVMVVGFRADFVMKSIRADATYADHGIEIDFVRNDDYLLANGVSVLAAQKALQAPFLLSMADHVYDVELVRLAAQADMSTADLHLCVDRRLAAVYDMDDATKVRTEDGLIVDIGKTIPTYDCVDTGVFAVSPRLFEKLQVARDRNGDCSLSDGVQRLASAKRARVIDIGDAFWQDVDTSAARLRAEQELNRMMKAPTQRDQEPAPKRVPRGVDV